LCSSKVIPVSDVTLILSRFEDGDPHAAEQLLPLVYDELRRLATEKMAQERPGQTLQATALVHEAYIRLVAPDKARHWNSRGHFFAAAAEAMRRILVESARRKQRQKRGAGRDRLDIGRLDIAAPARPDEAVLVDAALTRLAAVNPIAAELVKLRYFAGFSQLEAAEVLGVCPRKASQLWTYARAWLLAEIETEERDGPTQG
jgi:RNA polymerase sigma factor (TIGR02999 family)